MDAVEVDRAQVFEEGLDGKEAQPCRGSAQLVDPGQAVAAVVAADAPPDVRIATVREQAVTDFAERPEGAPVLHFDGPRTFTVRFTPALERGEKPADLVVGLGTKGLGWDAFALLDYDEVPEAARPLAEVEFPPKEPGERPPKVTVGLDRC